MDMTGDTRLDCRDFDLLTLNDIEILTCRDFERISYYITATIVCSTM